MSSETTLLPPESNLLPQESVLLTPQARIPPLVDRAANRIDSGAAEKSSRTCPSPPEHPKAPIRPQGAMDNKARTLVQNRQGNGNSSTGKRKATKLTRTLVVPEPAQMAVESVANPRGGRGGRGREFSAGSVLRVACGVRAAAARPGLPACRSGPGVACGPWPACRSGPGVAKLYPAPPA